MITYCIICGEYSIEGEPDGQVVTVICEKCRHLQEEEEKEKA